MRSTFYGLEVSRTGLYTSQNELNVTGHNISNVDTVGYTRQRLNTAAIPAQSANSMIAIDNRATAGRGVEAQTVDQIRDLFADAKYRQENSDTDYWEVMMNEFSQVESLFNSVLEQDSASGSIYSYLDTFYAALSALDAKPESKDIRENVLTAAEQLSECLNYLYGKMEEHHDDINSAVKVTVDRINGIAESIANLNKQIFGYELTGAKANDLRDQRNLLLDELSGLINIGYYEDAQGYLVVTIGTRELVNGVEYDLLAVDPRGADNQMDVAANIEEDYIGKQYSVVWADPMGQPSQNPRDKVYPMSGELKAYLDMRDGNTVENSGIPYIADILNEVARKIAREVNEVHQQGWTMPFTQKEVPGGLEQVFLYDDVNGASHRSDYGLITETIDGQQITYYPSTQGVNFFEVGPENDYSKVTAGNFRVSDEIMQCVYFIAASSEKVTVSGQVNENLSLNQNAGNNLNVKEIMALYNNEDSTGNTDNFQDRIKALLTTVANVQEEYNSMFAAQEVRLNAIEDERQSVAGVSIDEEMTNMVRFTHAYNANARVITAIDEELDVLINRMGKVGL